MSKYFIIYSAPRKLSELHTYTMWQDLWIRAEYKESPKDLADVVLEATPLDGETVLNAVEYGR